MKAFFVQWLCLTALMAGSEAVTIRNHRTRGCQGSFDICNDIAQGRCCERPARQPFLSARFNGLPIFAFGTIHEHQTAGLSGCGKVNNIGFDLNVCVNKEPFLGPRPQVRGSSWTGFRLDSAFGGVSRISGRDGDDDNAPPPPPHAHADNQTGCQWPDRIVLLDGHMFNTGSDVPREDALRMFEYHAANDNATVEVWPRDLLQYEVGHDEIEIRRRDMGYM